VGEVFVEIETRSAAFVAGAPELFALGEGARFAVATGGWCPTGDAVRVGDGRVTGVRFLLSGSAVAAAPAPVVGFATDATVGLAVRLESTLDFTTGGLAARAAGDVRPPSAATAGRSVVLVAEMTLPLLAPKATGLDVRTPVLVALFDRRPPGGAVPLIAAGSTWRVPEPLRLTADGCRVGGRLFGPSALSECECERASDATRGTRFTRARVEVVATAGGGFDTPVIAAPAFGRPWVDRCCLHRPHVAGVPHCGSNRSHTGWHFCACDGGVCPDTVAVVTLRTESFKGDGLRTRAGEFRFPAAAHVLRASVRVLGTSARFDAGFAPPSTGAGADTDVGSGGAPGTAANVCV
jgi:hypothetical protein